MTGMAQHTDDAIRRRGLRRTVPRGVVAAVLARHPGHLAVDEIQALIAREAPEAAGIARSSVYRALESLERAGLVVSSHFEDDARFEWAGDGDSAHHHLVCDACGAVSQVELSAVAAVEREAAREHGFVAQVRHLALRGRCGECLEAEGAAR